MGLYVPKLTLQGPVTGLQGSPNRYEFTPYKLPGFQSPDQQEVAGRLLQGFQAGSKWAHVMLRDLGYSIGRECLDRQARLANKFEFAESMFKAYAASRNIVAGVVHVQAIVNEMVREKLLGIQGKNSIDQVLWPTSEFVARLEPNTAP